MSTIAVADADSKGLRSFLLRGRDLDGSLAAATASHWRCISRSVNAPRVSPRRRLNDADLGDPAMRSLNSSSSHSSRSASVGHVEASARSRASSDLRLYLASSSSSLQSVLLAIYFKKTREASSEYRLEVCGNTISIHIPSHSHWSISMGIPVSCTAHTSSTD